MQDFLEQLKAVVGESYLSTQADDLETYGQDWSKLYEAKPLAVIRPANTLEVAETVKLCAKNNVALVPSGGRTGLSGGAYATNGELVLSLERLNDISNFNPVDRTVECGAGVITEQLQNFATENGLYYPVDFASAGSSHIGGNIATNAGGIKVLKYGLTRDWVSGLTVVTASGETLELNNGLVKNATGYDLRHLFIGSEGTLGIITKAVMKLTNPPVEPTVMLLAVEDLASVSNLLNHFQSSIELMAFEFFSQQALEKVLAHRELKKPFDQESAFYVLIEFEAKSESSMDEAFAAFESAAENGWLVDGIISQSNQQAEELWQYREGISESISHYPPYKNDIAVKPSQVGEFLQQVDAFVTANYPEFENIWFGHIGDGNLHLNILKPAAMPLEEFKSACAEANPEIFTILKSFNGSISAEHGVGLLKRPYLEYSRSVEEIELMKSVKKVFDPKGIMNPGKLFE
ncbi:FAD-binding oxidoreductase [Aliikangiella sp. G2MR2-5]|uniref:FAD-binding oxidoreductase n=1 Tax=Aliikangiella sp. G2MR2-5 TaxID=2788943 RepID=UPI0018A9E5A5|nr:FAD-binding oxidoreductase [Aliikangiella sp. G2MR2-5]